MNIYDEMSEMLKNQEPLTPGLKVDEVIEKYVYIRDMLRTFQKVMSTVEDDVKLLLDKYSMWLKEKADELGVDSFKTPHGTAYRNIKVSYRIEDWGTFVDFIKETNNFQLLEKRVAKNAAREIHQSEGTIPPGLYTETEIEFNVLRPKKSKTEGGCDNG